MKNDLHTRIRVIENALSKRERCLSEAIFHLGPLLRNYSAGELAEIAGVSTSTVTRFIKRLGYSHYKQAVRDAGEINFTQQHSQLQVVQRNDSGDKKQHCLLHLASEVENIQHTFDKLDDQQVQEIVNQLVDAEKLWIVGFNDDYALAHYARSLLIRVKSDIRMVPLAGFPVAEEFASISERDVIVVVAQKRFSPEVLKIIASGQKAGARLVVIGGEELRSIPGVTLLRYQCHGMYMFDSASAGISVITYLCAEVGALIGEPAVERLYYIESLHDEWN